MKSIGGAAAALDAVCVSEEAPASSGSTLPSPSQLSWLAPFLAACVCLQPHRSIGGSADLSSQAQPSSSSADPWAGLALNSSSASRKLGNSSTAALSERLASDWSRQARLSRVMTYFGKTFVSFSYVTISEITRGAPIEAVLRSIVWVWSAVPRPSMWIL